MRFLRVLVLSFSLLTIAQPAFSCMVEVLPISEKVLTSNVIVRGKVKKVVRMKKPTKLENSFLDVSVAAVIKGKVPKSIKVHFLSPVSDARRRCNPDGADFGPESVGKEFLFYLTKHGSLYFTSVKLRGAMVGEGGGGKSLYEEELAVVKKLVDQQSH